MFYKLFVRARSKGRENRELGSFERENIRDESVRKDKTFSKKSLGSVDVGRRR